jgi:ribosomal protein S18 acetylase RimI-like enzyme
MSSDGPAAVPIRVRRATEADLDDVLHLFGDLATHQQPWRVFAVRPDMIRETEARYRAALTDPDRIHVVAEADDAIVGMGYGQVLAPASTSDELALEISNVVVATTHRRAGVGRAIVSELARFGGERGIRRAVLRTFSDNADALAFWSALGFRPRYVQMVAELRELGDALG